jgi:hypothetical protein
LSRIQFALTYIDDSFAVSILQKVIEDIEARLALLASADGSPPTEPSAVPIAAAATERA